MQSHSAQITVSSNSGRTNSSLEETQKPRVRSIGEQPQQILDGRPTTQGHLEVKSGTLENPKSQRDGNQAIEQDHVVFHTVPDVHYTHPMS